MGARKSVWVGGRIRAPFRVEEGGGFRPDLILWLDAPRDQLMVADVVEPDTPASALAEQLEAGLARQPDAPQHACESMTRPPPS